MKLHISRRRIKGLIRIRVYFFCRKIILWITSLDLIDTECEQYYFCSYNLTLIFFGETLRFLELTESLICSIPLFFLILFFLSRILNFILVFPCSFQFSMRQLRTSFTKKQKSKRMAPILIFYIKSQVITSYVHTQYVINLIEPFSLRRNLTLQNLFEFLLLNASVLNSVECKLGVVT